MFKANLFAPAFFVMTPVTAFTLLTLMRIIDPVAAVASGRCFAFIEWFLVAGLALRINVLAFERVGCFFRVVEARLWPAFFTMTCLAFGAIAAMMRIVFFMAGNTRRFDFFLVRITFMALLASQFFMRMTQWKISVLVMIKTETLPAFCGMAFFTIGAIATAMNII